MLIFTRRYRSLHGLASGEPTLRSCFTITRAVLTDDLE